MAAKRRCSRDAEHSNESEPGARPRYDYAAGAGQRADGAGLPQPDHTGADGEGVDKGRRDVRPAGEGGAGFVRDEGDEAWHSEVHIRPIERGNRRARGIGGSGRRAGADGGRGEGAERGYALPAGDDRRGAAKAVVPGGRDREAAEADAHWACRDGDGHGRGGREGVPRDALPGGASVPQQDIWIPRNAGQHQARGYAGVLPEIFPA